MGTGVDMVDAIYPVVVCASQQFRMDFLVYHMNEGTTIVTKSFCDIAERPNPGTFFYVNDPFRLSV